MFFILMYFVLYMNHIILRTDIKTNDMQYGVCSGCERARKHREHKCECGLNQDCTQVYAGQGGNFSFLFSNIY